MHFLELSLVDFLGLLSLYILLLRELFVLLSKLLLQRLNQFLQSYNLLILHVLLFSEDFQVKLDVFTVFSL